MELSWIMMFVTSVALMTIVFFIYFSIRATYAYHNLTSNIGRIIAGSVVAGLGAGAILGFLLWCVLPTYYYVTAPNSEGYHTKYVYNDNFSKEYGRTYVVNQTSEDCFLAAMAYGSSELTTEEAIIPIEAKKIIESPHEIDGWFKPFPESVSTKSRGKIEWYVLTKSMLISEFNKVGVDLTK